MKTRKQKETNEKEIHLLEQKGYERMMNEIMPVQQAEVYRKPTKKVVIIKNIIASILLKRREKL